MTVAGSLLWVQTNGGKWWRYEYRFLGKRKLLALCSYPETSLAEAREHHQEARQKLKDGIDPNEAKKEAKRVLLINTENIFEAIGREWLEARRPEWTPRYAEYMQNRLEIDLFPKLGPRPIKDISAPELLSVIRIIENRGALELALDIEPVERRLFERNLRIDIVPGFSAGKADSMASGAASG